MASPKINVRDIRKAQFPKGKTYFIASPKGAGKPQLVAASDLGLINTLKQAGLGGSGVKFANPSATASDVAVNGSAATAMRSDAAPAVQKCSSSVFGLAKVDGTTITAAAGVISAVSATGANPTATASDVAVNGSAATFMRSDGAPAVQKGSAAQFGVVKADGTTITSTGGVFTATGSSSVPSAGAFAPGFTTGRYYSSPFNVTNATVSTATGKAFFTIFYVPKTTTFTKASFRSGATGVNGSMALYADSGGGQPTGAPLQQFGEIASAANAHAEITGLTITLAAGWYWLGIGVSGTVTLNSTAAASIPLFLLGQSNGASQENGYSMTWVYASGTLPTVGALTAQTTGTALVYLRL